MGSPVLCNRHNRGFLNFISMDESYAFYFMDWERVYKQEAHRFERENTFGKWSKLSSDKPSDWEEIAGIAEPLISITGLTVALAVKQSKQAYYFTRNNIGTSFKIEPGTPINTEVFEDLEPYIHKSDLLCLENVLYCAEGDEPSGYRYDPMYDDDDEDDDIYFDEFDEDEY